MVHWLELWCQETSWVYLSFFFLFSLMVLTVSADFLIDKSVSLSQQLGIPKLIIGATIVSLGTTFPEVVVSVLAALQGEPGLALGNAVGSIICDTGLILGLAAVIGKIPLNPKIVNRQGWIQLASGFLLVVCLIPFSKPSEAFRTGGYLNQWLGWVFIIFLGIYLYVSILWAKNGKETVQNVHQKSNTLLVVIKMIFLLCFIGISSEVLIILAKEMAHRLSVPPSIVAVTIVALGTSLPELVTSVASVLKGHGEVALGNIIGADILNVLLVAGASAAVTKGGLYADPQFFKSSLPIMLTMLLIFRLGIMFSKKTLDRKFGFLLIFLYLLVSWLNISQVR